MSRCAGLKDALTAPTGPQGEQESKAEGELRQLKADIPGRLFLQFKATCTVMDVTIRDAVVEALEVWLRAKREEALELLTEVFTE